MTVPSTQNKTLFFYLATCFLRCQKDDISLCTLFFLQILTSIFCKMILLFALSEKDVLWGHISKIRNAVDFWPFHHFWKWKAILLFEPCPLLIEKREVLLPSINSWWKIGAFNWLFHRRLAFLSDKGFGRSVNRYCLAVVSWRSFE